MVLAGRRRRVRTADPLSSAEGVRDVLDQLRRRLPTIVPSEETDTIRLLRATKHNFCKPSTKSKRGRRSKWQQTDLVRVESVLLSILAEKKPGTGLVSFVDYYLRILSFPIDVENALREGKLNLFEAQQLSRVKAVRQLRTEAQARKLRKQLLTAHLTERLSGRRLQERVNAQLRTTSGSSEKDKPISMGKVELGEVEPVDTSYLFWDELQLIGEALRDIRREDLTEELLDELLAAGEKVWRVIAKVRKREAQRESWTSRIGTP